MSKLVKIIFLFFVISLITFSNLFSQQVLVRVDNDQRQGLLFSKGSECFILTPLHELDLNVLRYEITSINGLKATATFVREYKDMDVAILRVEDRHVYNCKNWEPEYYSFKGNDVIGNFRQGYINKVEATGTQVATPVFLDRVDNEYLFISKFGDAGFISKGMSGSPLFLNNKMVGMLLSIGKDEKARVLRLDYLLDVTEPFFRMPEEKVKATPIQNRINDLLNIGKEENPKTKESFAELKNDFMRDVFTCYTGTCGFYFQEKKHWPSVRSIFMGEDPNKLDRKLIFKNIEADKSLHILRLPIRGDAAVQYAKLELIDGSFTKVKKVNISVIDPIMGGFYGLKIPPAQSSAGEAEGLFLIVGANSYSDEITLVPEAPFGTTRVSYSFDDKVARDAKADKNQNINTTDFQILYEGNPKKIAVSYISDENTLLGTNEYILGNAPSELFLECHKKEFIKSIAEITRCVKINFDTRGGNVNRRDSAFIKKSKEEKDKIIDRQTERQKMNFGIFSNYENGYLATLDAAPCTTCMPAIALQSQAMARVRFWAAVDEVIVTPTPRVGNNSIIIKNNLTVKDLPGTNSYPITKLWQAILPLATTEISIQYKFRDGTMSKKISMPIEQLNAD